jgi:hypothetical protein
MLALAAGCGADAPTSAVTAERDGLELRATVQRSDDAIVVDTRVRNTRREPARLATDLCGRITVAVVAPETFAPEGATWSGTLQAAKRHVLRQQIARQLVGFEARSSGDGVSADRPDCEVPRQPRELAPGQEIRERWVRSLRTEDGDEIEISGIVRVALVEDGIVDGLDRPHVFATGASPGQFVGRALQVEQPLGGTPRPTETPTFGQLYDRLMRHPQLQSWAAAQPASWHFAGFAVGGTAIYGKTKLRLLSSRYVRAAVVIADEDGGHPSVELPTEDDRFRPFRHRAATLPAGTAEIYEPQGFDRLEDVLTGTVVLPSGRLAVSDFFYDYWKPPFRLAPGEYRSFVTLSVSHGYDRRAPHPYDDRYVALATLVLSERPTVRWKQQGAMTTDGGLGGFSSPEGAARISRQNTDDLEWYLDRIEEAETSYDVRAGNFRVGPGLNVVTFAPGLGDGSYPIYIGYDDAGKPTRVVVDCGMLHLTWPG